LIKFLKTNIVIFTDNCIRIVTEELKQSILTEGDAGEVGAAGGEILRTVLVSVGGLAQQTELSKLIHLRRWATANEVIAN